MSRRNSQSLPNQIRRFREKRNLSLRDVAKLLGVSHICHIADWEKGRRIPNLVNALKISAAIGCPLEVLFCDQFRKFQSEVFKRRKDNNIDISYH